MNDNSFLLLFIIFLLIFSILSSPTTEKKDKSERFDYFKNSAETKSKIWYDPKTKIELAAMNIVTKRYVKKLWKTKIVEVPKWNIDCNQMSFSYPLKLASGELIFNTNQLPYYLK